MDFRHRVDPDDRFDVDFLARVADLGGRAGFVADGVGGWREEVTGMLR